MVYTPFKGVDVPGPKREFAGYGRNVPKVRWPQDARVAVNTALNYEEGSEYCHPNGDGRNDGPTEMIYAIEPHHRDLCAESVFEYGTRAGVWRVERLLTELKIPITVYACAVALEQNREVAAWLKEAGHEPCSHGWRWEEVWRLTREEEADHIRRAIESIEETCGTRPSGWYCRYGPSVNTRELLVEEGGFVYDSDAYNATFPTTSTSRGNATFRVLACCDEVRLGPPEQPSLVQSRASRLSPQADIPPLRCGDMSPSTNSGAQAVATTPRFRGMVRTPRRGGECRCGAAQ